MSILLEALKKSEEQRRLGTTPTLQTSVEAAAAEQDSLQHWLPLLLTAVSVIAVAWLGWQQYRPPEAAVVVTPGSLPQPPAAEQRMSQAAPGAGPAATAAGDAADAGERLAPASRDQGRTPVETFRAGENTAPATANTAEEAPATPGQPGELGSALQAEAESAEPVGDRGAPERDVKKPDSAVVADRSGTAAQPQAQPHESEPISYWELPQNVRDTLPEFKISVLVYAERAEDRFLLMGGQRLVEKDAVDGGLVLEEIRREGAVFRYRKYRFLVKG